MSDIDKSKDKVADKLDDKKDAIEVNFDTLYEKNQKSFEEFIDKNESVKKFLASKTDKAVSKAIETWQVNHLPKIIEEERKKAIEENDPNKPWLKEINAIKEEARLEKEARQRAELISKAASYMTQVKLDLGDKITIEELVQGNEEKTIDFMDRLRLLQAAWEEKGKKVFVSDHTQIPQTAATTSELPFDGDWDKYQTALKSGKLKFDQKVDEQMRARKYSKK